MYKPVTQVLGFVFDAPADSPSFFYMSVFSLMALCREKNIPYHKPHAGHLIVAGWEIPLYYGRVITNGVARLARV